VEASDPTAPTRPVTLPFDAALGPNTVVILPPANEQPGNLYVGSIYNAPDANMATLLRNDSKEFPKLGEATLSGAPARGNRIAIKAGQKEYVCVLVRGEKEDTLQIEDWSGGSQVPVLRIGPLPAGSDYSAGNLLGTGMTGFLVYKPGESKISVWAVQESGGNLQTTSAGPFDLGQPVARLVNLAGNPADTVLAILGNGEKAGVFGFSGLKQPELKQTITGTNEVLTGAAAVPGGLMLFSHSTSAKSSTRYYSYKASGATYAFSAFGSLPGLGDNDNLTIPEIRDRIVADQKISDEKEMKPYTNTIPGTAATYAMVPIPGGEFVMGSPNNEKGRREDEGPQCKVRISPFWMDQCEVTWNEYELFMYPDEEKRTRATEKTDESADKIADAVSHPSRPYTEMSFGMGKDGCPAIAMTQHAANKFCQWLSAKTGHFYRLPTEAEWEYACRAGTKTPYFFGKDEKNLKDYAWIDENSEMKYHKVGRKKPNPWGLFDMYGNVTEWVLDQYDPDYYKSSVSQGSLQDPWNRATKSYPHSVRGGSYEDEAPACRSAARRGSDRSWKMTDPQLPKSVWYFSDATFVGFRIVRPLKVPSAVDMQKYWSSGVERD
jgi:formylglycine-generating enzyme required for sulfatase activity